MEDGRIVELYWQRDERAIEETARKYGAYCQSIAYAILGQEADAEECVNDTYRGAWESIPPHRPTVLSTFLGKLTRRISIDRFRRLYAHKRGGGEMPLVLEELEACVAGGEDPVEEYERKRLSEVMAAFVRGLPEMEQKVFLCRYWYMESISSICTRFGYSESRVKSMLYRTREKLRTLLVKEGFP